MAGVGPHTVVLWFFLPLAVLVAGVAPALISFAAGQAGFTVMVIILFNILVPAGWTVGLVRVEDVALGCAVSVAVGLLLWPRGAAAAFGRDAHLDDGPHQLGVLQREIQHRAKTQQDALVLQPIQLAVHVRLRQFEHLRHLRRGQVAALEQQFDQRIHQDPQFLKKPPQIHFILGPSLRTKKCYPKAVREREQLRE